MRCDTCKGRGSIHVPLEERGGIACLLLDGVNYMDFNLGRYMNGRPCPDCNGSGQAHCCDGLCAQPSDPPGMGQVGLGYGETTE